MEEQSNISQEELDLQWKNICLDMCRKVRDAALAETDYIFLPDVTIAEEFKNQIIVYRQELRDFPAQWSLSYDQMTFEQKHGITPEFIKESLPTKLENN